MNFNLAITSLLTLALLASCDKSSNDQNSADTETAPREPTESLSNKLISPSLLQQALETGNMQVIDIRSSGEYQLGHIKGALDLSLGNFQDRSLPYGGMMSPTAEVERIMASSGVSSEKSIAIYDSKGGVDAARLWWILTNYGLANVYILNGGLDSWTKAGLPISNQKTAPNTSTFQFPEMQRDIYASRDDVKAAIGNSEYVIIDCRSAGEYESGHIPGAVNLDWANAINYRSDRTFKSAEELKEVYTKLGLDENKKIITYCASGFRSAHTAFVLSELLGQKNVENYDGSWIEWQHYNEAVEN